jgi:DNA-binding transcriptional LysR family regulator
MGFVFILKSVTNAMFMWNFYYQIIELLFWYEPHYHQKTGMFCRSCGCTEFLKGSQTTESFPAATRSAHSRIGTKAGPKTVGYESDRVPAILTMVAAGNGVTMVPHAVAHLIPRGVAFRALPSPQPPCKASIAEAK